MKGKRTYPIRRILAFVLALLLAVNMVPGSVLVSAAADTVTFGLKGAALTNKDDGIYILLEDVDGKSIATSQTTVDVTGMKAPFAYTITSHRYAGKVEGTITEDEAAKPVEVNFDTACTPNTAVISGYVADELGNVITQPEIQAFYDDESGPQITDDQISIAEDGKYSVTAYANRTVAIKVLDKAEAYAGTMETVNLADTEMEIANIVLSRTHYNVKAAKAGDGSVKYQDQEIPDEGIIVKKDEDASLEIEAGAGMKITELTVNDKKVAEAADNAKYTLQLKGITEDKEITASFANPTKMSASIKENPESGWINTDAEVTGTIDFGGLGAEVSNLKIGLSPAPDQAVEVKDDKAEILLTVKDEMNNGPLTVYAQYEIQGKTLDMTCETTNAIGIDKTKPNAPVITDDRDMEGQDSTWAKDADDDSWTKSGAQISYAAEDAGNIQSGIKGFAYRYAYGKDGSAEGTTGKDETATLVIDGEVEEAVAMKAKTVDQAGNESDESEHLVNVDTKAPVIKMDAESATGLVENGKVYYARGAGFSLPIQVTDGGVGCDEYAYEVKNEASETIISGTSQNIADPVTVERQEQLLEEGEYTLTVRAADRLGNMSDEQFEFTVDNTAPAIGLTFSQSVKDKILHILSFGLYSNDKIDVEMTITDSGAGLDKDAVKSAIVKDFGGNADVVIENLSEVDLNDGGKVTFEIQKPVKGFLNIQVQDRLGNDANYTATKENSNIADSDLITLEDTSPDLEMKADRKSDMFQAADGRWYNSNVWYEFDAADESGIYAIKVKVNGKELKEESITYNGGSPKFGKDAGATKPVDAVKGCFKAEAVSQNSDDNGMCAIEVEVTDNAGNISTKIDTIYFDTKAPQILQFHFSPAGNETADHAPVSIDKYGFFFKEDTTVSVDIRDYCKEGSPSSPGAGIHQVELKAIDGAGTVAASQSYVPEAIMNEGTYLLNVPADFKGQIVVTVDDNVATGAQAGAHTTSGSPYRTVIEGRDQTSASVTLPGTSYTDNAGLPLYNYDPTAKVRVKNTFAGLQAANYTRSESQGMQFSMDISQSVDGLVNNTFPTYEQDSNIYTSLAYDDQIVPGEQEVNGIELNLSGQCMAGHGFQVDTQRISIDKKAPTITVTWDNNDVRNEKYYKADRTATIRVEERNFDESQCEFILTGPKPSISGWSHSGDIHTATVTFGADGDYTFTFRTTDRAGHTSAYDRTDEFTVDKTAPVISVSYNNNDARNGYYYKEARTASLTITEHNFRASEVSTAMSANDNGAAVSAPAVNGWSSSGDINTATIGYTYDGEFTFGMTYEDLAGNPAAPYGEDHFVVDLTDPELEIYDIADKSANNDVVAPGVRYSDTNVDSEGVSISLKGANTGDRSMEGSKSVSANGVDLKLNDFPREKEVDDLYTMKAHVEDLSGRVAEQEILFSVNRFGSVYVLDDATKKLVEKNDGYTNQEQKVGIREINVDLLEAKDVSVSRDGDLSKLKEDKDYSVKASGDEGSWKEYYYQLDKENFEEEGTYNITIFSTDRANNSQDNKNNKRKEECSVEFVIDKTAPTTAVSGIENTGRYREPERNVHVDAKDNILLDKIVAEVGNEVYEYDASKIAKGNGTVEFVIKSADKWQNVKVYSVDKAGNTDKKEMSSIRVIVTSNLWVQFTHNTPVLVGVILVIVAIAVAAIWFFVIRKKEGEDQTA